MNSTEPHTIYTIGHSTHNMDEFLEMLRSFNIEIVADVRKFPGSRKFPHFDQESLRISLEEAGMQYTYLIDLGGRRKARKGSKNTRWNNASFRGYADYMETEEFEQASEKLESTALKQTTAYMCSEAVWWRCHRSMVSDYLKARGWMVLHIMAAGKVQEHRYTSPAIVVGEKISYSDENLVSN